MAKTRSGGVRSRYDPDDPDWLEHLDDTPVEVPTRLKLPQRQVDRVREIIRREMSQAAESAGWESFAEADDFDLPGEDPVSPYEEVFEPGVIESPVQRGAAKKESNNDGSGRQDGVYGRGASSGSVGDGRSGKDAGKAGGKAAESAGSESGSGRASAGAEGASGEG